MTAAHYNLDNLCAVIDSNGLQIDGPVEKVMGIEPLSDKWKAFGWHIINTDGHNMSAILTAFLESENVKGKPTVIIADTVKSKGVSFFEGKAEYHGVTPSEEELEKAIMEINNG